MPNSKVMEFWNSIKPIIGRYSSDFVQQRCRKEVEDYSRTKVEGVESSAKRILEKLLADLTVSLSKKTEIEGGLGDLVQRLSQAIANPHGMYVINLMNRMGRELREKDPEYMILHAPSTDEAVRLVIEDSLSQRGDLLLREAREVASRLIANDIGTLTGRRVQEGEVAVYLHEGNKTYDLNTYLVFEFLKTSLKDAPDEFKEMYIDSTGVTSSKEGLIIPSFFGWHPYLHQLPYTMLGDVDTDKLERILSDYAIIFSTGHPITRHDTDGRVAASSLNRPNLTSEQINAYKPLPVDESGFGDYEQTRYPFLTLFTEKGKTLLRHQARDPMYEGAVAVSLVNGSFIFRHVFSTTEESVPHIERKLETLLPGR